MVTSSQRADRGDETRARLIEAGLALFAARGYDGVATRVLAQRAGVNLAAIAYHFGGKDGLYRAVTDAVLVQLRQTVLERVSGVTDRIAQADGDRAALAALVKDLAHTLIGIFVGHRDSQRPYMAFVMREYMTPGGAFERLYAGVLEPMHRAVSAVATAARGLPREHPDGILAAHAFIGQILAFAVAGTPLLRRMGWDGYSTQHVDRVAAVVVPMALAAFGLERSEDE